MNNKNVFFIIIAMLIIIVIAVIIYFNYNIVSLKREWNITMPAQDEEIYIADNMKRFPENGERFRVLKYNNQNKINKINSSVEWLEEKDSLIEDKIIVILEILGVKEEYYPNYNYNYKYYYYEREYSKELILLYFSNENKMYIVENL